MKFLIIALTSVVASSSATITRDMPFINALVMPEDYKQNSTRPDIIELQKAGLNSDCQSYSDIYNHHTVRREVRDLISLQFVKVTLALCAKYTGFLMLGQGP
ncbi:hypothetical protein BG006_009051 [Podila minutissima]|uniref:Uncharacterized protein n=1 Tax=Podila minutissima TaxID=64525 RepID=A0A9P5SQT9_9FUNG|nr:hypothetical protein BG006_009051 [Podila minutissima]